MTLNLYFVRETPLARLYRFRSGREVWLPRAIINRTTKFPAKDGEQAVHQIELPDWKGKELGL